MKDKKMLVIVDMINDFAHENGALYFPEAGNIIPNIKDRLEEARENDEIIIFLCDSHEPDDKEFERFPEHAVENTWGNNIIDDLKVTKNVPYHVIGKQRYSGFYGTGLDSLVRIYRPCNVTVVGVCTSICVMDTVGGFANRDYSP